MFTEETTVGQRYVVVKSKCGRYLVQDTKEENEPTFVSKDSDHTWRTDKYIKEYCLFRTKWRAIRWAKKLAPIVIDKRVWP